MNIHGNIIHLERKGNMVRSSAVKSGGRTLEAQFLVRRVLIIRGDLHDPVYLNRGQQGIYWDLHRWRCKGKASATGRNLDR